MSTLAFYAQFVKSLVGVNSLTVTWDVEQITRSDGTRSALVTGGATSIIIGRRGLYGYLLASADTKLYDYVATAITAGDVDQKEIAALWTQYETDGVKPTVAGRTLDIAATGEASANVTHSAGVALTGRLAQVTDLLAIGGAGTYSYSNTVDDGSGNLLDGVFIQCATDAAFTNIVNTTHTNSLGAFTVYDDVAGTHYLRLQFSGITFTDQAVTLA